MASWVFQGFYEQSMETFSATEITGLSYGEPITLFIQFLSNKAGGTTVSRVKHVDTFSVRKGFKNKAF